MNFKERFQSFHYVLVHDGFTVHMLEVHLIYLKIIYGGQKIVYKQKESQLDF